MLHLVEIWIVPDRENTLTNGCQVYCYLSLSTWASALKLIWTLSPMINSVFERHALSPKLKKGRALSIAKKGTCDYSVLHLDGNSTTVEVA